MDVALTASAGVELNRWNWCGGRSQTCHSDMDAVFDESDPSGMPCPPFGRFVPGSGHYFAWDSSNTYSASYNNGLNVFNGKPIDGVWRLNFFAISNGGVLNNWCLYATLGVKRLTALEIDNASYFHLQDLTIETANATTAAREGMTTYGIHMQNCSKYEI